jgi:HK97 family phage major capsid protein
MYTDTDEQARRNALVRAGEGILAKAKNRSLTDAERRDYDGILAKIDRLDGAAPARSDDPKADMELRDTPREWIGRHELQRQQGPPSVGPGNYYSDRGEEWRSFGEFLGGVIGAGMPNRQADPRLFQARAASGLNEGMGSEGGFAVATDFSTDLLKSVSEKSKLLARCRQIPISSQSNGVVLPALLETSRATGSRWGGLRTYWNSEASQITSSKPAFQRLELSLKRLTGLVYLTEELLQDAAALDAFVRDAFSSEFGFAFDDSFIRGTGAGIPLGVLNSPCLVTVSKETAQAAATFNAENAEKMYSRLPAASVERAVWLINQDVWPQLFQLHHKIKNVAGTENVGGTPMFIAPGGISGKPYGTLLGLPIMPMEQCETLGTKGDVILADWGEYIVATKGGIQTASSIHVRFEYAESVLRFMARIDGQPVRSSAMTPYKGSNTQSPFVVLENRA